MNSQQFPSQQILFRPEAFWFGEPEAPLMGWYHPAHQREAAGSRQCGVVLCAPFGHEYMVAYRSYKHLAERLARAGFDVLFFDYRNTGDAGDQAGNRIEQWQADIRTACQTLREIAQVDKIALFGLRLGALLAASVLQECDASALIGLAPVISGRAYSRELRVLRTMGATTPVEETDSARQVSEDELTGYVFDAEMRASLAKLDMLNMPAPACPVLLIARDDVSGQEGKLNTQWQEAGSNITLSSTPGYAAMMPGDAYESVVPDEIWSEILAWLSPAFPISDKEASVGSSRETSKILHVGTTQIQEKLVQFDGYTGVLSQPEHPILPHLPAVILCNIGANHRVGTHRLYVRFARALAQAGFPVLRFDKAGIGYSKATPQDTENDVYADGGVSDIQNAMYFMENSVYCEGFVVAGLCSGAYFAYLSAIKDARVRGMVLMNQLVFEWHAGDTITARKQESIKSTHFYVKAVRNLHTWKRLFKGDIRLRQIIRKLSERVGKRLRTISQALIGKLIKDHHFLGKVARQFRQLDARGVEVMLIMDAGDASVDLMTENLGRHGVLLGDSERIRLSIFKGADHTFTPLWAQQYVSDLLVSHLQARFLPASATKAE
ncbi:serine aminopeptidase domain-containing protein [Undibacterium curvum]|uniref:serine aminopeptidase domain-containing protein n=1 Tax=Undibacterium curvum TaxID=2762294 RepID=UPI003D1169D4